MAHGVFHTFAQKPPRKLICTKLGFGVAVADMIICHNLWGSVKGGQICGVKNHWFLLTACCR